MILNALSIILLFVSGLSVILMVWAGVLSLSLASRWTRASTADDRTIVEDRSHLVLLVAVVVVGIRLLDWPLFYATLQSYVPDIEGAMCIFGVTQVQRTLTGISELLKPVSFFLIGFWIVFHMLDQGTRTASLMGRKLILLSIIALVVVVDSSLDIAQMIEIGPGQLVSCCTTVTDVLDRPTRIVPHSLLGPTYGAIIGYGYYIADILLMAVLALLFVRIKPGPTPSWRAPALAGVFIFAIFHGALFILAQIEVYAPKTMNLPFHHCVYCLWQYVPDTILMYALVVIGTSATGWAFMLDVLGRSRESMEALPRYIRRLCGFALFCFAASAIMNTAHLAVA